MSHAAASWCVTALVRSAQCLSLTVRPRACLACNLVQAEAAAAADLLFMWRQHLLGKMLTAKQYNLGLERYRCVP